MMRVRLIYLLAVFLAVCAAVGRPGSCEDVPEGRPSIEASPPAIDFGEVKAGERPRVSFSIRNSGSAELVIYDVKPSCGCTLAKMSSRRLAPGEEAALVVEYNSWNSSGRVSKFVEVRSNDPKRPLLYLDITGLVKDVPGLPGVPGT